MIPKTKYTFYLIGPTIREILRIHGTQVILIKHIMMYLKVALLYSRKSKKSFKALFLYQTPQKYYTLKYKKIQFICY